MSVFKRFAVPMLVLALVGPALAERRPPVMWLEPCEIRGLTDLG